MYYRVEKAKMCACACVCVLGLMCRRARLIRENPAFPAKHCAQLTAVVCTVQKLRLDREPVQGTRGTGLSSLRPWLLSP